MRLPSRLTRAIAFLCLLGSPGVALSASYVEGPVDGAGTIRGAVRFTGPPPKPEVQTINKDMEVCGGEHRMLHKIKATADGGLTDVVVFLEGLAAGKSWTPEEAAPNLLQKDCAFTPYLQAVKLGSDITVKNGDPVSHNIHTYELVGRARLSMFNVQQPAGSEFQKKIRLRRSRMIRLECDQHDFMIGWMYAVENPYYTSVAEDGSFSLSDVPAGTYKVKAWHPYLGFQEAEVTLSPGGVAEVGFEFK